MENKVDRLTRDGDGRQPRSADSEKITINLGFVDLGQINLIVADGFYSNRTDFIRTAIRNQLAQHGDVLKQSVSRNNFDLGLHDYNRQYLEGFKRVGTHHPHSRHWTSTNRGGRESRSCAFNDCFRHRPRCHSSESRGQGRARGSDFQSVRHGSLMRSAQRLGKLYL
jgi:Arc/MetJ-type ribon-helix-helix transcriptional regulator